MNLLIAFIGSGAIGALISGVFALIQRHLDRKDHPIQAQLDTLVRRLDKAEKDSVRTQLLLMIHDYPESSKEILELARHYFMDLGGDWYLTPIFNQWILSRKIGQPDWFNPEK